MSQRDKKGSEIDMVHNYDEVFYHMSKLAPACEFLVDDLESNNMCISTALKYVLSEFAMFYAKLHSHFQYIQ